MSKLEELKQLYERIHQCTKCYEFSSCNIKPDSKKVQRVLVPGTLCSKVFLVGQALGGKTQRLSGIPYTKPNEELSPAGKRLEKHLQKISYCMPHLGNDGRQMVYSLDIVQCYPGLKPPGGRDGKPTAQAIATCLPWLVSEIEIMRPQIIVLLGKLAAQVFLRRYCRQDFKQVDTVLRKEFSCLLNGLRLYIYVLPHPAAAYPGFSSIYQDTFLLVKRHLAGS